jgi:chromosome segregation protein
MHLKSLEITGFKSFAKKATLSFGSPISGIVGPNGSGKSNVAEAFRFVLGEQSIKSLRGKKSEDLIFNGGASGGGASGSMGGNSGGSSLGRANRASVKVVFDNAKRMLNIDFDEVTLERVVHRDSVSEYFINGSPVRLKDIIELLSGAHIGASGHHIISQGEADRILNANIRERREMVEDALGLKMYQYKKLESSRKLEKTEENMKSVESLRREIAPHLKFLKKQVEKVEKVEEMRRSLVVMYQEYLAAEDAYIRAEKARIAAEKKEPAAELVRLDRDLAEAKAILSGSKSADASSREIISLEQALAEARNEKDRVSRELGKIEGEISAAERAVVKEKERQQRDDSKTVFLRDVEAVVKRIFEIDSVEEIRKICRDFIARHRSGEAGGGNAGAGVYAMAIAEFEKDICELSAKKSALENNIKKSAEKETAVHEEYTQLREKIEREKDTNREAEKNVFKIIARQNEIRGRLAALKNNEDRLTLEDEAFRRELSDARALAGREAVDYVSASALVCPRNIQEERRHAIEKIKIRLEDAGAGGGADIMKEYKEAEERDAFLARELADLEKSKESLVSLIADLNNRLDVEFKSGISKINAQFQNFFTLMFGGGTASLTVVREKKRKKRADTDLGALGDDEIAEEMENAAGENDGGKSDEEEGPEGIDIHVSLPRKKVKGLIQLSGGERALTSIALIFAVSQVNPPPFIILDETDAALDEANSKKYGDMIENLSHYSQLILITHNRETMSRAGILYGVTMGGDGASKLLSLEFEQAVQVAK